MVLALALALGFEIHGPTAVAGAGLSVAFLGLTTVLLVADLEQPMRFLYILRRPQWGSWLARGAVVLISASVLTTLWLGLELGSLLGWLEQEFVGTLRPPLMAVTALAGAATAVYTAFLFGQAEGRDLWQSPVLPIHLLVQAVLAGSATLLVMAPLVGMPDELAGMVRWVFLLSLGGDLVVGGIEVGRERVTVRHAPLQDRCDVGVQARVDLHDLDARGVCVVPDEHLDVEGL